MEIIETAQAHLQAKAWYLFQTSEKQVDRRVMIEIDKAVDAIKAHAETIRRQLPIA